MEPLIDGTDQESITLTNGLVNDLEAAKRFQAFEQDALTSLLGQRPCCINAAAAGGSPSSVMH